MGDPRPTDLGICASAPEGVHAASDAKTFLPEMSRRYGAPRDWDIVCRCIEGIPPGRIFLSGAGVLNARLIPVLQQKTRVDVVGFVDRLAASKRSFEGLEVLTPAELARRAFDYVLVANPLWEADMIAQLRVAGVSPERIVPVYTGREYQALAQRNSLDHYGIDPSPADVVIVVPFVDSTRMIPDEALFSVFPLETTVRFYLGEGDPPPPDDYETIHLRESLWLLDRAIEASRPKIVYLQSRPLNYGYLSLYLRLQHPDIVLIDERRDFLIGNDTVQAQNRLGISDETLRLLALSEFHSLTGADLVISRRGGALWETAVREMKASCAQYFPRAVDSRTTAATRGEGEVTRLLFTEGIPPNGAIDLLKMMESLCEQHDVTIDIYNSEHLDERADASYSALSKRYSDGAIRYHRRAWDDMMSRLASAFHFGFSFDGGGTAQGDLRYSVTDRFEDYASIGLPVVTFSDRTFEGELAKEYQAGVVGPGFTAGMMREAILSADQPAMVNGSERLRRRMLERNATTIAEVAETVSKALKRGGGVSS